MDVESNLTEEMETEDESDSNIIQNPNIKIMETQSFVDNRSNKCSECGTIFKTRFLYVKHMENVHHVTMKKYECDFCDQKFVCIKYLTQHLKGVHKVPDIRQSCTQCSRKFANVENLRRHLRTHVKDKNFNCPICGAVFGQLSHMHVHFEKSHPGQHIIHGYKLSKCEDKPELTTFVALGSDETEGKVDRIFTCETCSRQFDHWANFSRHLKIHLKKKLFNCPVCNGAFPRKYMMNSHMQTEHSDKSLKESHQSSVKKSSVQRIKDRKNDKMNLIDVINKSSVNQAVVEDETEASTSCEVNLKVKNKGIKSRRSRKLHVEATQNNTCTECGRVFARKQHMKEHIKRKHNNLQCKTKQSTAAESPVQENGIQNEIKVENDVEFENEQETNHMENSGESSKFGDSPLEKNGRTYNCKVCDKVFANYGNFRRHLRTHSGLKPLECEKCGQAFVRKFRLEKHIIECQKNEVGGPENDVTGPEETFKGPEEPFLGPGKTFVEPGTKVEPETKVEDSGELEETVSN